MLTQPELHFDINIAKQGHMVVDSNKYQTPYNHHIDAYEVLSGDGAHLMHMKFGAKEKTRITINPSRAYVLFHFSIHAGRVYHWLHRPHESIRVDESQSHIFHISKHPFAFTIAAGTNEVFEISLTTDYFKSLLPPTHEWRHALALSTESGIPAPLHPFPTALHSRTKEVLHELFYQPLSPTVNPIYIKAKILELIALQHHHQSSRADVPSLVRPLSETDRERMYQARDILDDFLSSPPTIKELSKFVGTNECYLKNNFKQVFGITVYGYVKQARMEKAHKLLTSRNRKIAEVAQLIGYRHASHFTAAFKQHFGYTPNQIHDTSEI